ILGIVERRDSPQSAVPTEDERTKRGCLECAAELNARLPPEDRSPRSPTGIEATAELCAKRAGADDERDDGCGEAASTRSHRLSMRMAAGATHNEPCRSTHTVGRRVMSVATFPSFLVTEATMERVWQG